ncbi:MAG TPA: uracil-DNA glycosylase family protein [Sphingobium sp.]|uniref:uracil-DNA glycosylase family protein n=1 Tax=Sphingobium sp. TaxID=1912891 RepID=UPI002ED0D26B
MTPTTVTTDPAALAAAVAHWWALAGVDVAVQEAPRDWLARQRPALSSATAPIPHIPGSEAPTLVPTSTPSAPIAQIAAPMPDDLDSFMTWLANDPDQPEAAFSQARVLPQALPRPDMLVITDMPTQEDMGAGRLFSSADAPLLSGMLRSIGVERDKTATASLLLARPAGGIIEDALMRRATDRLLHFIRLVGPRAVILLGDRTSRAFEQTNGTVDGLSTHGINLDDGMISAMPLPAPFVLLKHPERKAAAWVQLRHLAKR